MHVARGTLLGFGERDISGDGAILADVPGDADAVRVFVTANKTGAMRCKFGS